MIPSSPGEVSLLRESMALAISFSEIGLDRTPLYYPLTFMGSAQQSPIPHSWKKSIVSFALSGSFTPRRIWLSQRVVIMYTSI